MSSSDIESIEEIDIMEEIYEKDIEQVLVGSSSEEEVDSYKDEESITYKKVVIEPQKEEDEIYKSYEYLQTAILALDGTPTTKWGNSKTLKKGTLLCQELHVQENNFKIEAEVLLQENWLLKKRLKTLKKKKKRKSATILTRRASGPILGDPQREPPLKRASLDDSKMKDLPDQELVVKLCKEEVKPVMTPYKNPRKKSKKRAGLTDEEKEFSTLEEKIEDLLYEVDALWNEIKDDEELDEEEKTEIAKCARVYMQEMELIKSEQRGTEQVKYEHQEMEVCISTPQEKEASQGTKAPKSLQGEMDISKFTPEVDTDEVDMSELPIPTITGNMEIKIMSVNSLNKETLLENVPASNVINNDALLCPVQSNVIEQNLGQGPTTSISGQSEGGHIEIIAISDGSESDSSDVVFIE